MADRGDRDRPILVVTPYSLEGNPYLPLLLRALRAEGVRVELARGSSPFLLWRALRRHGIPRIVHLQWHHRYLTANRLAFAIARTVLFFVQWALLRALGARFVWTVHNLVEHEGRHARWEMFACRLLVRMVDAPVAHCGEAAREVAAAYHIPVERVRVVPHGLLEVTGSPDRDATRRSIGLTDDDIFLLNFGRIRAYKGIDRLLDAFRRADAPRMHLAVAGFPDDPELADALRQQGEEDPRLTFRFGLLDDQELSSLLCACDAVVLPYRNSLTSGAAVLAAAHARPVIAPALGCLRELPADGAIIYDENTEDGLHHALARAAGAPLDALGAVAREHAQRFPWELVARRTLQIYDGLSPRAHVAERGPR